MMRTTVDLDETLIARAQEAAPGLTKTALIEAGLRALVKIESARRLADMIGHESDIVLPPRRKMS